jgi:hypothetical protein
MKNTFITLILIAIFFTGCKKENTTGQPETQKVSGIEQRILNFEQQLQSGQKDGTAYAIDSAVWYVEALLNYNLGSEGVECSGITVDTAQANLPIPATGEYTLSQLETVYNQLMSQVQQNQPEATIMFAADLDYTPIETVMVFTVRTSYATPVSPAYKSLNDTSGYWFWGGNAGMCGPDSGLYVGMDATDILTTLLNPTWSNIWTSLETISVSPNYPGFNYYDPNFPFTSYSEMDSSRIFRAFGDIEVLQFCFTPDMIHYYASGQGIGYIIKDLTPERKYYAHCFITSGVWDMDRVFHHGSFTYGIPLN